MPTQKFQSQGKGLVWKDGKGQKVSPIGVRFDLETTAYLRSLPNTQDFIRAAVAEKLEREKSARG